MRVIGALLVFAGIAFACLCSDLHASGYSPKILTFGPALLSVTLGCGIFFHNRPKKLNEEKH